MKDKAIIVFCDLKHMRQTDVEVPLNISATELFVALNTAFHLGENIEDSSRISLKCENPIALLKGNRTLMDFGVHDGSYVMYT